MSLLVAIGMLLFGIVAIASVIVTLLVMIAPAMVALLVGYGIWRLVLAFRAIERERTATREEEK